MKNYAIIIYNYCSDAFCLLPRIGDVFLFERLVEKIVGIFPEPLRKLYYKYESAVLYLFFGAVTTAVSIGTQYLSIYLGAGTKLATTISWVCSVTVAFFTNKVWVFRSGSFEKKLFLREAAQYYGARLVSYFLELGFMILTVDVLLLNPYAMKLIAQIFVLTVNYLFSRFVIFRKNKKETAGKSGERSEPD